MNRFSSVAHRPPLPRRIAGNLAFDLANTISLRGTKREFDHLHDADAILAWAKHAGVVDASYSVPAPRRAALVADVQRLRGAIDAAGASIASGKVPPAPALAAIRDLAARSFAAASLTGAPVSIAFARADRIIGPLAWAALDLLRSGELARLKQCPPHDCRWLFIDRTKNGSRRWCEMATCGARAKKRPRRRADGRVRQSGDDATGAG